jgi:exodeoxyribonuclease VII small subunit
MAKSDSTFEEAMQQLEEITRKLEDGDLGLGESLECYEKGIGLLKGCHGKLREAEQKISLLTEVQQDGTPVTESFDEAAMTLEEKQESRGRRRSQPPTPPEESSEESDMDIQKGLF